MNRLALGGLTRDPPDDLIRVLVASEFGVRPFGQWKGKPRQACSLLEHRERRGPPGAKESLAIGFIGLVLQTHHREVQPQRPTLPPQAFGFLCATGIRVVVEPRAHIDRWLVRKGIPR